MSAVQTYTLFLGMLTVVLGLGGAMWRSLGTRLDALDTKIGAVDQRLTDRIDRFEAGVERRFAVLEASIDERFTTLDTKIDERFATTNAKLDERTAGLRGGTESLERLMDAKFDAMGAHIGGLRDTLDARVRSLEGDMTLVKTYILGHDAA